jgi:hypothetical protein
MRSLLYGFDWRTAIPLLALFGILGTVFYVLQFPLDKAWSVVATAAITAGAAALAGSLLGLLFGIPKAKATDPANSSSGPLYQGNSNLEQVSDWLTKLLLGAGLVQLGMAPAALARLANSLGQGFGGTASSAGFGLALVIFYAGCGFLYLYLWCRLSLPKKLTNAETAEEKKVAELKDAADKTRAAVKDAPAVKATEAEQEGGEPPTAPVRSGPSAPTPPVHAAASLIAAGTLVGAGLPRSALTSVQNQIEGEVRRLLAATGHTPAANELLESMTQTLAAVANVPPGILNGIRLFTTTQHFLTRAGSSVDDSLFQSTVDSGSEIAQSLQSIPRVHHVVNNVGIPLYSDEEGGQVLDGTRGIILVSTSPDNATPPTYGIYPTSRINLAVGQEVSWEWDSTQMVGATWYQDPADQTIKKGWDSSAQFVGRDLSTI